MLQIDNQTPFEVAIVPLPDEAGVDTLYMVVKATFGIGASAGRDGPTLADEQLPVLAADEPRGEPAASSLQYAGELHLAKPTTDVVLIGSAQRRDRRPAERLDVRLRVGPVAKTVRVFGDRPWKAGLLAPRIGPTKPFAQLPLLWENAFGGVVLGDRAELEGGEPRNPVGRGFTPRRDQASVAGTLLPNLEDPAQLIGKPKDRPPPAGFGFVAPYWQPRAAFAGTYDEAWQLRRAPYLPADFDSRFFNAAAPGLTARGFLEGGEPVELDGAWIGGPLRFALPRCRLRATVARRGGPARPPLRLETVLLEPDEERLSLLWRAALQCDKSLPQVAKVTFELMALDLGVRRAA